MRAQESRPAANGPARSSAGRHNDEAIIDAATLRAAYLADLDAVADHLRGYFVVQVTIDDEGHRRTSLYRSAGAAERAVQRATDRGRRAHVTLCQLLPVGVVVGGGAR